MTKSSYTDLRPLDPHPDLQEIAKQQSWKPSKVQLAVPILDQDSSTTRPPRNQITLTENKGVAFWEVPSLTSLFRGHQIPPATMNDYPQEYLPLFYEIEQGIVMYCNAVSLDPLDAQCEEYYEATRKRPDGRSLAPLHDVIRSARTWKRGHTSRNYIAFLRKNF